MRRPFFFSFKFNLLLLLLRVFFRFLIFSQIFPFHTDILVSRNTIDSSFSHSIPYTRLLPPFPNRFLASIILTSPSPYTPPPLAPSSRFRPFDHSRVSSYLSLRHSYHHPLFGFPSSPCRRCAIVWQRLSMSRLLVNAIGSQLTVRRDIR